MTYFPNRTSSCRIELHRLLIRFHSRLSLQTVWWIAVPVISFTIAGLVSVAPNDFWWHLRTGRLVLAGGQIPTTDLFTFTRFGEPWINQAWLMQVAYAILESAGGLPLILVVHALTLAVGYTLVLRAVIPHTSVRAGAVATLIGLAVGAANWSVRPQSISFLAFGTLVVLLESYRHGRRKRLWWAIPLFAVWVNSHGGFVFGIGALGLFICGQLWDFWRAGLPRAERRRIGWLALLGIASLAALTLNPQGLPGILRYVWGFLHSNATLNYNVEFAPMVIRQRDGLVFFGSLLVLGTALARSRVRLSSDQWLNLLVFAALALFARRNAPWYGFLLIPVLAAALHGWWRPGRRVYAGVPLFNGVLLGLFALAALIALPWWRAAVPGLNESRPIISQDTPVAAVRHLCQTIPPGAHGFQFQVYASYLVDACPELPLFADTRVELYPETQWQDYLAILGARYDWERILARYRVTYLFLSLDDQPHLVRAAASAPAWQEIYRDHQAVIFDKGAP